MSANHTWQKRKQAELERYDAGRRAQGRSGPRHAEAKRELENLAPEIAVFPIKKIPPAKRRRKY